MAADTAIQDATEYYVNAMNPGFETESGRDCAYLLVKHEI